MLSKKNTETNGVAQCIYGAAAFTMQASDAANSDAVLRLFFGSDVQRRCRAHADEGAVRGAESSCQRVCVECRTLSHGHGKQRGEERAQELEGTRRREGTCTHRNNEKSARRVISHGAASVVPAE